MTILLLSYNDYGLSQFGNKTLILMNDQIYSENYKKGDLVNNGNCCGGCVSL